MRAPLALSGAVSCWGVPDFHRFLPGRNLSRGKFFGTDCATYSIYGYFFGEHTLIRIRFARSSPTGILEVPGRHRKLVFNLVESSAGGTAGFTRRRGTRVELPRFPAPQVETPLESRHCAGFLVL